MRNSWDEGEGIVIKCCYSLSLNSTLNFNRDFPIGRSVSIVACTLLDIINVAVRFCRVWALSNLCIYLYEYFCVLGQQNNCIIYYSIQKSLQFFSWNMFTWLSQCVYEVWLQHSNQSMNDLLFADGTD